MPLSMAIFKQKRLSEGNQRGATTGATTVSAKIIRVIAPRRNRQRELVAAVLRLEASNRLLQAQVNRLLQTAQPLAWWEQDQQNLEVNRGH